MARSASIYGTYQATGGQVPSLPMSVSAPWSAWVLQDLSTIDAATITNPETQITASTRRTWLRQFVGTSLQVQAAYPRAATLKTTNAQVIVFGRSIVNGTAQEWNALVNDNGDSLITIEFDPTDDADDGSTYKYTTVKSTQWLDSQGYDEFIIGLTIAAVLDEVSVATAFLRLRSL